MRESLRCLGIAVCVVAILFVACALVFVRTDAPTAGAPVTERGAEAAADGGVSAETREDGQGDADGERTLAVVMYHNILKSSKGTYTVSPAQFESDLAAYVAAGYETVFPSEVIAFVCGEGDLPEKPLLITFDDGRYNNMYYGLPLLEKYGAKAAFYPVGAFSAFSTDSGDHSNPNYSHLTWAQMGELAASGHVELGSHSYNMHRYEPRFGVRRMKGESETAYRKALLADAGRMQDAVLRATGAIPLSYAFPFGAYSDEAYAVLRALGVKLFLTCSEHTTTLRRGDPTTLMRVGRFNRAGELTTAALLQKLAE